MARSATIYREKTRRSQYHAVDLDRGWATRRCSASWVLAVRV